MEQGKEKAVAAGKQAERSLKDLEKVVFSYSDIGQQNELTLFT